jgi:hypothetical protein
MGRMVMRDGALAGNGLAERDAVFLGKIRKGDGPSLAMDLRAERL